MSRATSIKEAIAVWEKKTEKKADESEHVCLICQIPSIDKMDASLSTLKNCTQLSLSSNQIEKIANLNALNQCNIDIDVLLFGKDDLNLQSNEKIFLEVQRYMKDKNLRILSLGRNNIKSLTGLEAVGDSLNELWISYNNIEKLKGISVLRKLTTLYMVHNKVNDAGELNKLDELPCLETLTFNGNPLANDLEARGQYRLTLKTVIKKLKQLDGSPIIRNEGDDDEQQVDQKG